MLKPILEDLEFKTMIPRVFSANTQPGGVASTSAPTVAAAAPSSGSQQLSMFGGAPAAAVETETKNLNADNVRYKLADTPKLRKELAEKLLEQTEFAVETVTDEETNFDFILTNLAFSFVAGEAWMIPLVNQELRLKILKRRLKTRK